VAIDGRTDSGTDGVTRVGTDGGTHAGTHAGTDSGTDGVTRVGADGGTHAGTHAGTDSGTDRATQSEPRRPASLLSVIDVTKTYPPDTVALRGVSLEVAPGEIVALLGPSGCGKSTLLRLIAGLDAPDSGDILLEGQSMQGVPAHERRFGLMFQEFALFPHLDVAGNVAFGLRMAGLSEPVIDARVAQLLHLVNLEGYGDRSVHELSGGERQRVALARSLAPNPRLLMLDEPLGDLDRALREDLLGELRPLLTDIGQTALYVTHDQQEAYAIADRMVVMDRGLFEQVGPPQDVWAQPSSPYVASFLGLGNLVPARVDAARSNVAITPVGRFAVAPAPIGAHTLLIRPDSVGVVPATHDLSGTVTGVVASCSFRGSVYRLAIDVPFSEEETGGGPTPRRALGAGRVATRLEFDVPAEASSCSAPTIGEQVTLSIARHGTQLILGPPPAQNKRVSAVNHSPS